MPVKRVASRSEHSPDKTRLKYVIDPELIGGECASRLLEIRKKHIDLRDEMLSFQKEFSSMREWAKFFKQEARHHLGIYRAACLLIPWVCAEFPGDCEQRDPYEWPEELFPSLDYASSLATMGYPEYRS